MTDKLLDTNNEFYVGKWKQSVHPMLMPVIKTKQQGYRFAAWVVAVCEVLPPKEGEEEATFEDYLKAIRST